MTSDFRVFHISKFLVPYFFHGSKQDIWKVIMDHIRGDSNLVEIMPRCPLRLQLLQATEALITGTSVYDMDNFPRWEKRYEASFNLSSQTITRTCYVISTRLATDWEFIVADEILLSYLWGDSGRKRGCLHSEEEWMTLNF